MDAGPKVSNATTRGYQAELDPEEAEQDAAGSSDDLADVLEEPAFLDGDGPSAEIPPFITTTNARELYALCPGETVSEAIARRNAKGESN